MILHWSPKSPFVRKVVIVLDECGLSDRVERRRSIAVFAAPPNPAILADNPLGKIPALVTDDGLNLFDSRVICEYLIELSGHSVLLPASGPARLQQLRWQALGDGLTDILLLWRMERTRDRPDPVIASALETKTRAALAVLERESAALGDTPFGLGHVAVVCMLGQLDFRYAGCNWRAALPGLAGWYEQVLTRPSVAASAIVDDGEGPLGPTDGKPAFVYEVTP